MSESTGPYNPNELSKIYGKLNSQDVEQFYAGYQLWQLQQQALSLEAQIEDLRREIAANAELLEMVHLPAIALATVARLQASGVKDIALLDRMVERGEEWLDRTMQRLDYCEQLDFINDDYTQWCQNALEGAYDWIDSMREGGTSSSQAPINEANSEATEELLLQKLTSEVDEQSSSLETPGPEAELSSLEEPVSTPPELAINGEQSDPTTVEVLNDTQDSASSSFESRGAETVPSLTDEQSDITAVEARLIAPQDREEETVQDFDITIPKEEVLPSEEQAPMIEEAQESVETQPNLEETTPELQEEQLPQVSQPVEAGAAPEPLEGSPATDISNEIEQAIEEETFSNYDAMNHPAPLHALPPELSPIPDNQSSTIETSENEQPTSPADREFDSAPEEPLHTQPVSEAKQPASEIDTPENTEQGSMQGTTLHRHHNFLQRLVTKILGS